jgi:putative transposase
LIRWEKKSENYLAFLHLACACIAIRAIQVFG